MRYRKFIITNYKGIQSLVIELDKQPKSRAFTLVGLNESGKTSILEAIYLLENGISDTQRHTLIPKREKINFNGKIEVSGEIELSEEDNQRIAEFSETIGIKSIKPVPYFFKVRSFSFKDSKPISNLERFNISFEVKYEGNRNYRPLTADENSDHFSRLVNFIEETLMPSIIYYPDFLFDFPNKIYLDQDRFGNDDEQLAYYNLVQDILSSIRPDLLIKNHLVDRLNNEEGDSDALNGTLNMMGAKITHLVFTPWGKIFKNSTHKEIVVKCLKDQQGRPYIEFKLKEGTEQFEIQERSLGFRWFFVFLLFTEVRKNRMNETGEIVFLLDEPANNLHSTAQQKLLETFKDLTNKSFLIYTTHSHHLINPEWLEGVYIVKNNALEYEKEFEYDANKTDIQVMPYKNFVRECPDQRSYFQPVLDALDVQPGLLEKIDSIVIAEGKFDYYLYKYINKVYFNEKYKLNFYPGGGADANNQIIRLYTAWQRKFVILLDADAKGVKAKKTYIEDFGLEIKDRVLIYSDIDPDWTVAPEFLFTEDERDTISKEFPNVTSYEKGKFNTAIQTLLMEEKKVPLSDETLGKFERIFVKLKAMLEG